MESSRAPLMDQQLNSMSSLNVHPQPEHLETLKVSKEERYQKFMSKTKKKHTSALKKSPTSNLAIYDVGD